MSQPDRPSPDNELPPTEHLPPTPKDDADATLPAALSRKVASWRHPGQPWEGPRYSRLGIHARGGLGEIFLAQDEELPREVALKEIRSDRDDDQSRLRFLIEGTITGSLEHPGIVPVYSLGTHGDGRPFYAMRLIRGQSLQQAIAALHFFTSDESNPNQRLRVDFNSTAFRQLVQRLVSVCQTLQYAHDRGVIHRDLKPANIMVGDYGETLVVDWGLAKIISDESQSDDTSASTDANIRPGETVAGQVLGTPAYMSPEQAAGAGNEATEASDIYSLGATLYHLLTGQNPLARPGKSTDSLERVRLGDIAAPQSVLNNVPRPLQAICQKAMALKPETRYASAGDLAADLERWLADEPLQSYREPVLARGMRWLRKHPGIAATGATSLTLLLVAATVVSAITASYSRRLSTAYDQLATTNDDLEKANTDLTTANTDLKVARDLADSNAAQARQNEEEAEARAAETEAVLTFVQKHILAAARPEGQAGGLGRNILLRDAVKAAASAIEASFPDQPIIESRVRLTLGESLLYLGELPQATEQYETASRTLTRVRGKNHPATLAVANDLATCYSQSGQLAKARALFEQTVSTQREQLGENAIAVFDTLHSLATVYEDLGMRDEALKLREEIYQRRRKTLGPKHGDTLKSMNDLAYSYMDQGRLAEAVKISEQALAGKQELLGPTHPETLGTAHTLAVIYSAAGRGEEALKVREETYRLMMEKLGPEHYMTLGAMQNLANSYSSLGRPGDALKLYEEALQTNQRTLGAKHPGTLEVMDALANLYAETGRFDEAIRLGNEALAGQRELFGSNHPTTINTNRNVGLAYAAAGKLEQSEPLFAESYRRSRDQLGADYPLTLIRMFDLALTYQRMDRDYEAAEVLEEMRELQSARPGDVQADLLVTMNMLAKSYIALRQGEKAEEMLLELLSMRTQYSLKHPQENDARCYWAQTFGQLGQAQEIKQDLPAANTSYQQCVAAFAKLAREGKLASPYFEGVARYYQLRQSACSKIESAVGDIDVIPRQPPQEIALLLEARFRILAAQGDLEGLVATAKMMDRRPRRAPVSAYLAGAAWSLASSLTDDEELREEYAKNAIERLQRVKPGPNAQFRSAIAQAYAFHYDPGFAALREREDFQALLEELPSVEQPEIEARNEN